VVRSRLWLVAAVVAFVTSGAARADTLKFNATLEPDQQGKPGKGNAALSLDTQSKTLTGTIEYSGLAKPPAMAAFLAPPPKQNADPVTLPIPLPGKTASPIVIKMQLGDPQIAGLKTGEWLLLIGSKQGPEIGGEVKPAP
jgi:CHRD domain-containing protein